MKDAVDSVIAERERLDRGFPAGLVMSLAGHLLIAGAAFALPILMPAKPKLQVSIGIAIPIPRGGGGSPTAGSPDGGAAQQPPVTQAPEPEPPKPEPVKVVKPPKEAERKGLPDPKADKKKAKAKKPEPARPSSTTSAKSTASKKPAGTGAQSTTASSATPGVGLGPVGPGLPGGTTSTGDWYLAAVQQKIWMIWNQQLRTGTYPPVTVRFTILGDGQVTDVAIVQSSGQYLLDQAAQRAVLTAGPFSPLPRSYDTKAFTLQAVFQPVG
ncbi:MAG: TonB C-terminal domain-containing protein [Vicinamibacteria bacterium]|nr:TonB C-terminal domain-containing protein [Vicinamibacteria bacterium]